MRKTLTWIIASFLVFLWQFVSPTAAFALSNEFGAIGAIPSLSSDGQKQAATDKLVDMGMGWTRHEFFYQDTMDFGPYDAAQQYADARGIKTLGLLGYPGHDKSHDQWKQYVGTVVERYKGRVQAWEIMNEIDNHLSGGQYTPYLKEAHEIIKSVDPSATIVLSGITSRPETPNFWSEVAAAGGWNYFDVAGLHVYHEGSPEKVNFGGGDLLAEYDRAIAALRKNGGGKKIWITELGYQASGVGEENQANWLARTLVMTRSVAAIEKIFIYRLWDGDGMTYGLSTSSLGNRPVYEAVKTVISALSGRGIGTRLYPQSTQSLDAFDAVSGWSTKATHNGSTALSAAEGKSGGGMRIGYQFTADQAYAVAEKSMSIAGQPQALAAWFYGDDTKNVWKYRFKDAKGETFQADLGNLVSGWSYKQFTIGQDTAYVSWGGDGKIDYPISFNSFVIDRQGGEAAASGVVDELIAVTGGADFMAFQFGNMVSYWKANGTGTLDLCGASRAFGPTPAYVSGVTCADAARTAPATATEPAKTVAKAATPKPTPSPLAPADKSKTMVRVDGENTVADGQTTYRIVLLVKDVNGQIIKNRQPVAIAGEGVEDVTIGTPTLVGDEWWILVSASTPGDKQIALALGDVQLDSVTLTFVALPTPVPSVAPSPTAAPLVEATVAQRRFSLWWIVSILLWLAAAVLAGWKYYQLRGPQRLTSPIASSNDWRLRMPYSEPKKGGDKDATKED